jgi:hypothetical protein
VKFGSVLAQTEPNWLGKIERGSPYEVSKITHMVVAKPFSSPTGLDNLGP